MSKTSIYKFFRGWGIGLFTLIVLFFTWDAGVDANRHHYMEMVFDLLIAALWAGWMALLVFDYIDDKMSAFMDGVLAPFEKILKEIQERKSKESPQDATLKRALINICKDFAGNSKDLKQEHLKDIRKRFYAETGHDVHLSLDPENGAVDAKIATSVKNSSTTESVTPPKKRTKIEVKKGAPKTTIITTKVG